MLSQVVDYRLRSDRSLTPGPKFEAEDIRIVQIISGFSNQLRARGIDLIVVPDPTRLVIYPQHLSKSAKAGAQVSLPLIHLVDELLTADVEVVNLLQSFRMARAQNPRTPLYYRTDHHWTAVGIRLGAREVKERLARYAFE